MIFRRFIWRLGRALYSRARGERPNAISSNGEYLAQREFVAWCARHEKRVVVFDAGANIGQWTMSLVAEARRRGASNLIELHAFEPVERAFRILDERCSSEARDLSVRRVQCALSRSDGVTDMYIVGPSEGTNSLYLDPLIPSAVVTQIRACTADGYCRDNGILKVHLFKSDTEGHDFDVLLGAEGLFNEERVDLFQFEYNHRWVYARRYLKDVFDFVDARPYLVGKLTRDGIEIIQQWHPELERFFETNYVLIHKDALGIYSHRVLQIDGSNTYA